MRLLTVLGAVAVFGLNSANASSGTYQTKYVSRAEPLREGHALFQHQGLPAKSGRCPVSSGGIVLLYDEAVPDSVRIAADVARKMWESKLRIELPVYIEIGFGPLGNETPMLTETLYIQDAGDEMSGCPGALASQILKAQIGTADKPDGRIVFNSDIDWSCCFAATPQQAYNLPTMALRGMARCLGAGATVREDEVNSFSYSLGIPSYYDRLLFNSKQTLCDLKPGSSEMARFVKSDNVFVHGKEGNYKVHAPSGFEPGISLSVLEYDYSPLSYTLGSGSVSLTPDGITSDILEAIGWNRDNSGTDIRCTDIKDDGIGSSYTAHTFSLSDELNAATDYSWRFMLKNRDGKYVQVSTGTSPAFTINVIASPENYYSNINGDLEGLVECEYKVDGAVQRARPFVLSLEQKPVIRSIDNIRIIEKGEYTFCVAFEVHYTGADRLQYYVEEEYDTSVQIRTIDEPYYAHVVTRDISNLYYSWVTVEASNKYGTVSRTLEFDPSDLGTASPVIPSENPVGLCIYSLDGRTVFEGTPANFGNTTLRPGLYLKKSVYADGSRKTEKILLR